MVSNCDNSFARKTVRKSESKLEFSLNNNKIRFLCSTTVATLVAKHLNSARNYNLKENSLHALLDNGGDKSFINKRWTSYSKQNKIVKPTTWTTGAGTMQTKPKET